jgi:hypothetical protein
MTTFRCTAKLLKRLGIKKPAEPPPPQNALGDWYVNILYTRYGHYLLCVCEHSRLPVLLTARDLTNFPARFLKAFPELLSDLNVPAHQIEREVDAMQPLFISKTASRSLLGTINDFAYLAKEMLAPGNLSLYDVTLRLAQTPCLALESMFPDEEARKVLSNPLGFTLIDDDA